jgi:PKD repeat protein
MMSSVRRSASAWGALAAAIIVAALGGCKLNKERVPDLSGPSELAMSLQITARPDVLTADGFSTASIQVVVRNQNGQPVSGQALTFAITDFAGRFASIGTLTPDVATTGSNGIAQVIYQAPPRTDATANNRVLVVARPITGDAAGQIYRSVEIELRSAEPRLFPQIPGNKAPNCNFLIEPALGVNGVNQSFLFQSTSSDIDGTIVRYEWDFGDGVREDKPDVQHRYSFPGQYTVTHVVTDNGGLQAACAAPVVVQ